MLIQEIKNENSAHIPKMTLSARGLRIAMHLIANESPVIFFRDLELQQFMTDLFFSTKSFVEQTTTTYLLQIPTIQADQTLQPTTRLQKIWLASEIEAFIIGSWIFAAGHFYESTYDLSDMTHLVPASAMLMLSLNYYLRKLADTLQESNSTSGFYPFNQILKAILPFGISYVFAQMDGVTRDSLVHESGHALAFKLLYQVANLKMVIGYPRSYVGCHDCSELSELGQLIGAENTMMAITAAGPMASMLWNYASLIVAAVIPEEYSEAKRHLRMAVLLSIMQLVVYAVYGSEHGDFEKLAKHGLSINTAITAIVGSILLLQTVLSVGAIYRSSNDSKAEIVEIRQRPTRPVAPLTRSSSAFFSAENQSSVTAAILSKKRSQSEANLYKLERRLG